MDYSAIKSNEVLIDEPQEHMLRKPDTNSHILFNFYLYKISRNGKIHTDREQTGVARDWDAVGSMERMFNSLVSYLLLG